YHVQRDKIEVIYNPVDLVYIDKAKEEAIDDEYASIFSTNRKVIVTAGRLVKEKDQQTLLRAFQQVVAKVDCNLVLLGEVELEHNLKTLAKELNIEDYVYFIGFQQNPYKYFYQADV